ncbi:MAG TPA: hypothetical protein ENO21_00920, partial [Firmicutes bacterium]|nr:hypothetical protein [Bacillota bacterium]
MRLIPSKLVPVTIAVAAAFFAPGCTGGGGAADDVAPATAGTGHNGAPPAVPGQAGSPAARPGFALPRPSELPLETEPRGVSYTEQSLYEYGGNYQTSLPFQNYTEALSGGEFDSSWSGSGLEGAAYAMFQFTVDGYDRLPQLRYRWTTPPDPISAAYIGLADFTNDRWDWWQCDEHGWFSFGDIAPYTRPADDAMIAAVVVAGATGTASLRYLRLGHPGVEAVLTSIPPTGIAPLSVTLNGGGTTTFLGSVTDYHWNFDGDGTIDLSGTD